MTLTELFEAYARKHLRGKSENTFRLYRHTIRSFGKFLRREPTIEDLDSDLIEDHMWRVVKSGRSIATANKDRSQLICLWNYAARKRIVETHPDVPQIQEPERVPMAWMPDEVDRILSAARVDTREIGGVKGSTWWTAMLLIILDTGERIGAVRALPRNCIHGDHLLVPAAIRKGKTRDRLYRLSPNCIAAIEKLVQSHSESDLFPFPYSHTYLYRRYRQLLEHAGLPIARGNNFHRLRKTVASAVARAGGDATAALDHASPKTTKSYLDCRIVGGVQVSEILAAYLRDPTLPAKSTKPSTESRKTG
jgi:integrase